MLLTVRVVEGAARASEVPVHIDSLERCCHNQVMWVDALTVLSFAIAVLTWFGITPQRIRELTTKHMVRNRLTLQSMVITALGIALIVFYVQAGVDNWWPYAEASWVCLYSWLVYATGRLKDRPILSRSMKLVRQLAPTMYVFTTFARLDHALRTGVFAGTSSFDKWMTLGTSGLVLFIVGFSVGSSVFYEAFSERIAHLEHLAAEARNEFHRAVEELRAKLK